jgi:prephenate dehydratase
MRLGYLGPPGTFSEEAVRTDPAAREAELVGLSSIHATVMAVQEGVVDRAVVPIENSLEGPVVVTLDTLVGEARDVAIVGEVVLTVNQCLVARGPIAPQDVERVLSHPQALAQCAGYLRAQLPHAAISSTTSTADAVRQVAATDAPWAALGPRRAAELHAATILAEGVEDEPGNQTRFVWLAPAATAEEPSDADRAKTSLAFWGAGDASPGWLVRCLSEFAFRGVNLSKIESRPLRGRLGHYRFYVDCEGRAGGDAVAAALAGLRTHCEQVRVLGSYEAYTDGLERIRGAD